MNAQLLIPAAGMGARLGSKCPKALVEVAGKPMLARVLERFQPLGLTANAVIVITPGHRNDFERALGHEIAGSNLTLVDGGSERQESVQRGLACLAPTTDIVVIHDAARPFVSQESVYASITAATQCGAATVAMPCIDTILEADANRNLMATPDRRALWACQTPQTFQVRVIREAHAAAQRDGVVLTDDASLVRRVGATVRLVPGAPLNFKITTSTDLALADCVVRCNLV